MSYFVNQTLLLLTNNFLNYPHYSILKLKSILSKTGALPPLYINGVGPQRSQNCRLLLFSNERSKLKIPELKI